MQLDKLSKNAASAFRRYGITFVMILIGVFLATMNAPAATADHLPGQKNVNTST